LAGWRTGPTAAAAVVATVGAVSTVGFSPGQEPALAGAASSAGPVFRTCGSSRFLPVPRSGSHDERFPSSWVLGFHPRRAHDESNRRFIVATPLKFRYRREYNEVRPDRLKTLLGSRRSNGASFPLAFSRGLKDGHPMVGWSVAAVLHRHFSTASKSRWRREVAATSVSQHPARP
jgi:hypothetical protein